MENNKELNKEELEKIAGGDPRDHWLKKMQKDSYEEAKRKHQEGGSTDTW